MARTFVFLPIQPGHGFLLSSFLPFPLALFGLALLRVWGQFLMPLPCGTGSGLHTNCEHPREMHNETLGALVERT